MTAARRTSGVRRLPAIDRTAKLFIGGKQARPDSRLQHCRSHAPDGTLIGEVGTGNRKDIRNAVEAARKAADGWAGATAHNRAQILYYVAENLARPRRRSSPSGSVSSTGAAARDAGREVEACDPAPVHVCGVGRQVGWPGAPYAVRGTSRSRCQSRSA